MPYALRTSRGFTLIELILVVGILIVFSTIAVATLNPVQQINKATDSKKEQALESLKVPLEEYFNDVKCYPQSLSFGSALSTASKTYVGTLPQDPDCANTGSCYVYETDNSSCPQWYVAYAKLKDSSSASCSLVSQSNCVPGNYQSSGYNFCVASSDYTCSVINQYNFASGGPTSTPTPACNPVPFKCTNGCNNVGVGGDFCGFQGCVGNACCNNTCQ